MESDFKVMWMMKLRELALELKHECQHALDQKTEDEQRLVLSAAHVLEKWAERLHN